MHAKSLSRSGRVATVVVCVVSAGKRSGRGADNIDDGASHVSPPCTNVKRTQYPARSLESCGWLET